MSRRRAGASKTKGKTGERMAKKYLQDHGWLVADSETQGLAGDDLFARDPDMKWWSIEVKNTSMWTPKYITQAKKQAKERQTAIQHELTGVRSELLYAMQVDRFRACDWLVLWHPSNANCRASDFVAIHKEKHGSQTVFESPFIGNVEG